MTQRKRSLFTIGLLCIGLSSQAPATLIDVNSGSNHRRPFSQEINPPSFFGVLTDINGTGTLGPITFLAALGNPAASNLPGPVSGALDSSLFSVTPNGLGVTVSWDLIGTGYTLAYVLVETDFTAGVHPPHHLAQYDVWRSNQHLEVAQGSQFVDNFFNHGVPVSHVSFYGVLGEFHAPETADTLSLLVIGIGAVFLFRCRRSKAAWR